jgi:hypothetical protein
MMHDNILNVFSRWYNIAAETWNIKCLINRLKKKTLQIDHTTGLTETIFELLSSY